MEKFNIPGVYHYRMQETAGSYEGIVYDATVYDIYAFVLRNETGSLYVKSNYLYKAGMKNDG